MKVKNIKKNISALTTSDQKKDVPRLNKDSPSISGQKWESRSHYYRLYLIPVIQSPLKPVMQYLYLDGRINTDVFVSV